MTRPRAPIGTLLVAALLLVVGIVTVVHLVRDTAPPTQIPEMVVERFPQVTAEPDRCARQGRDETAAALRDQHRPGARVTSEMVNACPSAYDQLEVTYVGELVGDLLHRDGGAWVLANDDDYALEVGPLPAHDDPRGLNSGLSVWLPDDLLDQLTGLGQPDQRGDVVALRGHVLRTDPADGGGLTLRATHLDLLAPATTINDPLDRPQALLALTALIAAGLLWAVRRRASTRG